MKPRPFASPFILSSWIRLPQRTPYPTSLSVLLLYLSISPSLSPFLSCSFVLLRREKKPLLARAGSGISSAVKRVARLGRPRKDSDGGDDGSGARGAVLNAADLAVVSRSDNSSSPDQCVTEEIAAAARRLAEEEARKAAEAAAAAAAAAAAKERTRFGSRLFGRFRRRAAPLSSPLALTSAPVSGSPSFSRSDTDTGLGLRERMRMRWARLRQRQTPSGPNESEPQAMFLQPQPSTTVLRPNSSSKEPPKAPRIAKPTMNPLAALARMRDSAVETNQGVSNEISFFYHI